MEEMEVLGNGGWCEGFGNGEDVMLEVGTEKELRRCFVMRVGDMEDDGMGEGMGWFDEGSGWLEEDRLVGGKVWNGLLGKKGMELNVIEGRKKGWLG